jgi:hypothetical protein
LLVTLTDSVHVDVESPSIPQVEAELGEEMLKTPFKRDVAPEHLEGKIPEVKRIKKWAKKVRREVPSTHDPPHPPR